MRILACALFLLLQSTLSSSASTLAPSTVAPPIEVPASLSVGAGGLEVDTGNDTGE